MSQTSSHQPSLLSQQQLALDIFSVMDSTETSIVESGQDFHLKKSTVLVDVSDVGLLARRILNGAYFLAQGDPDAETHVYDLRYFKWLINYANSNNNTHLKRVIREAQKSAVQVNVVDPMNPSEENWMSVPMLGAAAIKGRKIHFRIPSELRPQLRDPQRHAFLSMRILAGFSSIYALELYERLCVFRGSDTPWWSIDEFKTMIRVDNLKIANDFRYFKRDILSPAIEQINETSDIDVAMNLKRTGRFISHISFRVVSALGTRLQSSIAQSKAMYEILVSEFGLSDVELDEISAHRDQWPDARIQDAIDFVRHRCNTSSVQYPGKYLMKAIRDGYRVGTMETDAKVSKERTQKILSDKQKLLDEVKSRSPFSRKVSLPEGEALERAWQAFIRSPNSRLFKVVASSFELADTQQQEAFKGFLALQG